MKTILYMATTVNGIIAKDDDSADFLTSIESASYVATVCKAGAVIVGRRTYEVLSTQPEFEVFRKEGVKVVAISHDNNLALKDTTHRIAHSPKEALELLTDCSEVVIAGGGILNASFMKENLIDEMYLDIEPAIVGKRIPLFNGDPFDRKLELLGQKLLSENEIQLHYKVVK